MRHTQKISLVVMACWLAQAFSSAADAMITQQENQELDSIRADPSSQWSHLMLMWNRSAPTQKDVRKNLLPLLRKVIRDKSPHHVEAMALLLSAKDVEDEEDYSGEDFDFPERLGTRPPVVPAATSSEASAAVAAAPSAKPATTPENPIAGARAALRSAGKKFNPATGNFE